MHRLLLAIACCAFFVSLLASFIIESRALWFLSFGSIGSLLGLGRNLSFFLGKYGSRDYFPLLVR
ncbi:hypothetical protein BDV19DRAFT_369795 [Aspergillus venezuelensis]